MDCMFIFKYKHTIDLRDLCLDQNRLIENFLFNKMQEIEKYLFQSYVIKINLINPKIIFNHLYKLSIIVLKNFVCNRMKELLKLIKQFSLDSERLKKYVSKKIKAIRFKEINFVCNKLIYFFDRKISFRFSYKIIIR